MSDKILRKMTVILLCAAVLVLSCVRPVAALEPLDRSQGMSLTITDLPDSDTAHEILLYKIADMTDDIRFEFTEEYSILEGYLDLDILVTDRQATAKWSEAARLLLEVFMPQLKTEPLATEEYGDGTNLITFYDLEPGLYLVKGDGFEQTEAGVTYDFSPMLVSVPYAADDDDALTYNVWSSAKVIEITLTPTPTPEPTPTEPLHGLTPTPYPCTTCTPYPCTTCTPKPPTPTNYQYPTPTTYHYPTPTKYVYPTYSPTPYRPPVPQTGDTTNIWIPIAGIAAALIVIVAVILFRRKRNSE